MSRFKRVDPAKRKGGGTPLLSSRPDRDTRLAVAPPPLREGQHRCQVCRNAVTLTPAGVLRRHHDLFGQQCWNKATGERFDVTAEVVIPAKSAPPTPRPRVRAMPNATNERSPNGHCQECDKRIPPGRRLCGRCNAHRT